MRATSNRSHPGEAFDASTSLLVSQFIPDREERTRYFRGIADRLRPGGFLVNADLAADASPAAYHSLRDVWFRVMKDGNITTEAIEKMRAAYDRDVAVLPPEEVRGIISAGSFEAPIQFLQTGLIRA